MVIDVTFQNFVVSARHGCCLESSLRQCAEYRRRFRSSLLSPEMFAARRILRFTRPVGTQATLLRYSSTQASARIGNGAFTIAASALALSATAYAIAILNATQLHADAGSVTSATHISEIVPVVEPQALAKWEVAGVYAWGDNR